ncbi:MAG TPA: amidase [Burkholderiaceae bacterium]|nr:amidase [Burkholderiaceae bacterium]
MDRQPWQWSATELADAYRRGVTTPSEHTALLLARIERLNPQLNAVVTLDPSAREQAAASTARLRAGRPRSALDGVPVTIKDNMLVAGLRATWGSRLFADFVPAHDELPVARLRAAGAVILGKTNVPEFTLQGYTDNPLFGPTRNPWDTHLTPGGSSGGAVAAVAAGLGPLAFGTDGGGSIRRPASHAGLVGLKPSRGRVPRADGFPAILLDYEVAGPMARTVSDIVAAMSVLSEPDRRDPGSAFFEGRPFAMPATSAPRRILFAPNFDGAPVDPEIATSIAAAARRLEWLGHRVDEAPNFDLATPVNEVWSAFSQTGLAWLLTQHGRWRDRTSEALIALADAGRMLPATSYFEALDRVQTMRVQLDALFVDYDVILTPTAAALPWTATETHPPTIAGRPVGPRGPAVFTGFVNAAGLPAISVPCKPSAQGLPIGVQLIARHGEDALLCALAAQFEQAEPWADRWPAIATQATEGARDVAAVR